MKKIRSLLFAMALCFAFAGVADASTCLQYCGTPPFQFCCLVQPTPTPGFTVVTSSYTLQDNEILFCNTSSGWCEKTALGSGGFYNGNVGTDFGSTGGWPINHVQSRLHRTSNIYRGTNFQLDFQGIPPGYNGGVNFAPNSFSIQN